MYALIQGGDLEKIYYTFDNNYSYYLNYTKNIEIKGDIEFINVLYALFNQKFTDADFQTNPYNDFKILYRNEDDSVFAELK